MAWVPKTALGVAAYDFVQGGKYQISLQTGDEVKIVKETTDWYKGVNLRTGEEGIFPAEFIELHSGEGKKKKR